LIESGNLKAHADYLSIPVNKSRPNWAALPDGWGMMPLLPDGRSHARGREGGQASKKVRGRWLQIPPIDQRFLIELLHEARIEKQSSPT
jgi:hypothetical protein